MDFHFQLEVLRLGYKNPRDFPRLEKRRERRNEGFFYGRMRRKEESKTGQRKTDHCQDFLPCSHDERCRNIKHDYLRKVKYYLSIALIQQN